MARELGSSANVLDGAEACSAALAQRGPPELPLHVMGKGRRGGVRAVV